MRFLILIIPFFIIISTNAMEMKPTVSLAMASKMADACENLAKKENWRPVNIAIYDDGGNLKLFRRQDDSFLHSIKIAEAKARTSSGLPMSTRQLGELAYSDTAKVPGIELVSGFVVFPGGLPILTKSGHQIGGIGVSGATADQDEQCAQAGIDAIQKELN